MVAKALEFLTALREERPDLENELDELYVLYEGKLWHQLSTKLETIVDTPAFEVGDVLIRLYTHFVSEFGSKLNQLKFCQFASKAGEKLQNVDDRIAFLEEVLKALNHNARYNARLASIADPCLFINMAIIQDKLVKGEMDTCKKSIVEAKENLEQMTNVDPVVSAKVYYVGCQLHKSLKNYGEFYRDALMYLTFSSFDTIAPETREALAVDVALAALLADDVYNFGELLLNPIVNLPKESKYKWMQEILEVFNRGDMTRFEEMQEQHRQDIEQFPELVDNFDHVRQKITIMCLLDLIFRRPADERRIPLKVIGEQTKLDVDGVEFLLMRALSLRLIKGTINQVDEYVQITWVHPRVLTMPELQGLYDQMTSWISKVASVNLELEQESFGTVEA